jgi:hypothetical protein
LRCDPGETIVESGRTGAACENARVGASIGGVTTLGGAVAVTALAGVPRLGGACGGGA